MERPPVNCIFRVYSDDASPLMNLCSPMYVDGPRPLQNLGFSIGDTVGGSGNHFQNLLFGVNIHASANDHVSNSSDIQFLQNLVGDINVHASAGDRCSGCNGVNFQNLGFAFDDNTAPIASNGNMFQNI